VTAYDAIVIGGGLVGSAIAFGLQRQGLATLMLDEGDLAFRAARGNFGLIWVQSKGTNSPPYAQWTWMSAESWPRLRDEIQELSRDKLDYTRPGGLDVCLNAAEMDDKRKNMQQLKSHANHIEYEMLDRKSLTKLLPGLGDNIAGGCYSTADGHVNPLKLLRGLHVGLQAKGGNIESGSPVVSIDPQKSGFLVKTKSGNYSAARLIIAAGLGTKPLAHMVDLNIPVRPVRGQNLILERVRPFLTMPMSTIRQTAEGSVQVGASEEEVGFDECTSVDVLNELATRAVRIFPHLGQARVVRSWAALRIMTPDGYPIYAQSVKYPGAFAAVCHSGVTLAAAHVFELASAIAKGSLPTEIADMGDKRFAHD
jgi:glycine/D-amino acid oxidase-like deaminating enzyme